MTMSLATAPNFRDFGGHVTRSGATVRSGLIYRSEALLEPTEEDARVLADKGIALVCDLRSEQERDHAPNAWFRARGIEHLELDILQRIKREGGPWAVLAAQPDAAGATAAMQTVYAGMPDAGGDFLVTIFDRIAAGRLPLLIHCTAGKDRTGFVSAIILAALGVAEEDIFADYLLSAGRRTARAREATRVMLQSRVEAVLDEATLDTLMGVEPDYLRTSFDTIRARYGGVEPYLAEHGLSSDTLSAVKERLLA
ncbi:tyrosine-protein phosphatase [Sphingomonas sp. ID0503]|uniref:tyrosine-protein phosphatase n=1 Tax=Sphingomonas sp. ID0503 TaxID=3399691 RepID=UPI003AFA879D